MYKFIGKPGKMYSLDSETTTIKLNYNCPDSEKVGSGPGSCGGSDIETGSDIAAQLSSAKAKYAVIERKMLIARPKMWDKGKGQKLYESYVRKKLALEKEIEKLNKNNKLESNKTTGPDKHSNVSDIANKATSGETPITLIKYSDKLFSKLTNNQKDAIKSYSVDSKDINSYLRTGKIDEESMYDEKEVKNIINNMDSIFKKVELPEATTVYRGINSNVFKNLSDKLVEGSEFKLESFIPTTPDKNMASTFAKGENSAMLEIRLPKGSKALSIENYTRDDQYKSEKEITLNRNMRFSVLNNKKVGSVSHIILEAHL